MINLDLVARIVPELPRNLEVYRLEGADGETLGTTHYVRVEEIKGTFIPAAPGASAYVMGAYDIHTERPTIEKIYAFEQVIAAWRIDLGQADPIFVDGVSDDEWTLIPQPDGRLIAPYVDSYDNIEQAKLAYLEDCQQRFDYRQSLAARDAAKPEAAKGAP